MSKKILSIICALALSVGTGSLALAAEKVKGKITAIEGNTLTIGCEDKAVKVEVENPGDFKVGDKVKCKDGKCKKKRKVVEGC
jgi:predicted RNA methylase